MKSVFFIRLLLLTFIGLLQIQGLSARDLSSSTTIAYIDPASIESSSLLDAIQKLDIEDYDWKKSSLKKSYYGFGYKDVIIKIDLATSQFSTLTINKRFIDKIHVYESDFSGEINEISKLNSNTTSTIEQNYKINPQNKLYIYALGQANDPLIVPFQFKKSNIEQSQNQILMTSFLIGFGALALITCLGISVHHKYLSLNFITTTICFLLLYRLSADGVFKTNIPILNYFDSASFQLNLITGITVLCLYIQANSQSKIFATPIKFYNPLIFNLLAFFLIVPSTLYLVLEPADIRNQVLLYFHIPAILVSVFVTILASASALKNQLEQGLLLLAWITIEISQLLEVSTILGLDHSSMIPMDFLINNPEIYTVLTITFLMFWVILHHGQIMTLKHKTMQDFTDQLILRNNALEINQARATDLSKNLYAQISQTLKKFILASQDNQKNLSDKAKNSLEDLEEQFQKITLLGQDISETLIPADALFNLIKLLEKMPVQVNELARAQHIQVKLKIEQSIPEFARGDQSLLYRALLLIVEHRLKSAFNGRIKIECSRINDARSPQIQLKIKIEDTASPLDQHFIEEFMDKTPRLSSTDFQLVLARDMIKAMGGEMIMSHNPKRGNIITCRVALYATKPPQAKEDNTGEDKSSSNQLVSFRHNFSHLSALIISTQTNDKLTLESSLRSLGIRCHTARNLDEATALLLVEDIKIIYINIQLENVLKTYTYLNHPSQLGDKKIFTFTREAINSESLKKTISTPVLVAPFSSENVEQHLSSHISN